MCLYPTLIKNRKYIKNKKNEGRPEAPPDTRVLYIPIGCGNCIECRKQKAREWQIRLTEEIRYNTIGKFVTLTLSNQSIKQIYETEFILKKDGTIPNTECEKYPYGKPNMKKIYIKDLTGYERDNEIATVAVRRFLERYRKEHKKSVRHWLVTELGHKGTENIHLHGIIWTNDMHNIEKHWKYGFIWKGYNKNGKLQNYVSGKTISYISKYITKVDIKHKEYKSKILCSPGIGKKYTEGYNSNKNEYKGKETDQTYQTSTGHKIALPTYYRNKLYSEREREQLWLNQLDKEERWVCGERVDISETSQDYYILQQYYRKRNVELGYGGRKNENRKQYEETKREIMLQTRLANALQGKGSLSKAAISTPQACQTRP